MLRVSLRRQNLGDEPTTERVNALLCCRLSLKLLKHLFVCCFFESIVVLLLLWLGIMSESEQLAASRQEIKDSTCVRLGGGGGREKNLGGIDNSLHLCFIFFLLLVV